MVGSKRVHHPLSNSLMNHQKLFASLIVILLIFIKIPLAFADEPPTPPAAPEAPTLETAAPPPPPKAPTAPESPQLDQNNHPEQENQPKKTDSKPVEVSPS